MSDTPESDKNSVEWDRANEAGCSLAFAQGIERERDELRQVISNFCEETNWAVDAWKNQDHIKPLFDIHAKTKEAK
jgi:hypothetical protein